MDPIIGWSTRLADLTSWCILHPFWVNTEWYTTMNVDPELYARYNGAQQVLARQLLADVNFTRDSYDRMVDVGCGTGEVTNMIQGRFPNATILEAFDKVSLKSLHVLLEIFPFCSKSAHLFCSKSFQVFCLKSLRVLFEISSSVLLEISSCSA